jgi:hypothetical protein
VSPPTFRPPPVDAYLQAVQACWREINAVVIDDRIWAEEAARDDAEPLPWPLSIERTHDAAELLRWLAGHAFSLAADWLATRYGAHIADGDVDGFQLVLRVIKRAVEAAEPVLRKEFGGNRGGAMRLSGGRDFSNWFKAFIVDFAERESHHQPLNRTTARLPFTKSSAYRARSRSAPGGNADKKRSR